jgi:Flp pilus assembly protein CpaB
MELARKSPLRAPSTPTGALAAAAVAAVLAGVLVFGALKSAKNDNKGSAAAAATRVVVADRLIPKGSPADAIATGNATRQTSVAQSALVAGAVTDFSQLRDKVATHDILPGQQLSADDFTAVDTKSLSGQVSKDQRAVSIPLDTSHGMVGQVKPGDRVDVFAGFNVDSSAGAESAVLKPLASNVLVLKSPKKAKTSGVTSSGSVVTLRLPSRMAAKVAFSSDNGKVWVVLRSPAGAPKVNSAPVGLSDVIGSDYYLIKKKGKK